MKKREPTMLRISEGCGNITMVLHIRRVRAVVIQPFSFNLKIPTTSPTK